MIVVHNAVYLANCISVESRIVSQIARVEVWKVYIKMIRPEEIIVLNKEMKYKLVVHDHLNSVVHCKTVKRNNRKEKREKERKKERKKERERERETDNRK